MRFLQLDAGKGDYTRERDQILPDWDAKVLVQKARELQAKLSAGNG